MESNSVCVQKMCIEIGTALQRNIAVILVDIDTLVRIQSNSRVPTYCERVCSKNMWRIVLEVFAVYLHTAL